MKEMISGGLRAACDILLPRKCLACGRILLRNEEHLCLGCLADMPRTFYWSRSRNPMADRFNDRIQTNSEEGQSSDKGFTIFTSDTTGGVCHEHYAYAAALFFYRSEASYKLIPYQIKYHGNIQAGRYFGRMLGRKLASSELYSDADLVIPVPLHWTRKWKRGYNQAEVIARAVAGELGTVVRTDLLKRIRRTGTQTKVEVESKSGNVSGAFIVDKKIAAEIINSRKGPRHILIVDDVFTSGSTLYSCFVALREVFPPSSVRISVATLGFVGGV